MKPVIKTLVALCGALCVTTAGAHGTTQCEAIPQSEWKPQMELQRKLSDEGWKVRQVKTWNGCYEVYGTTPAGARAEAFFNPKTFERVDGDDRADEKK
jgi:hypothetical protein